MDTINNSVMSSVQQRTQTKRGKPKKKNNTKPIKVVYISNPMKVKISASGFRALVQELTGQDAESPPDPSRFQDHGSDEGGGGGGGDGWYQVVDSDDCLMKKIGHDENVHTLVVPPPPVDNNPNISQGQQQQQPFGGSSIIEGFEPFDDAFTPQMIENLNSALLW
ncbi:uncharacterized protein LOC133314561 [Gastrolobium bilobum]|uniref:uncharacterized protein LOC133314561 n=1 Tax=Gastrolobium bilobum TaxID=150636 RepID=UPI002AB0798D|nr:uncharacterized protein LOC133314561 [Gastrolobium bilobum]